MMEFTLGCYTLYLSGARKYLSQRDGRLTLEASPYRWTFKERQENQFNIYAEESELLLDIHNAYVGENNMVKLWNFTGYDVQIWSLLPNGNGTYSIVYCKDHRYCLGFSHNMPVLQLRMASDPMQEWRIQPTESMAYGLFRSSGRTIHLQLPRDICTLISPCRVQQWAEDLEKAYEAYCDLTGFRPYSNVIIEAYKPIPGGKYAGYALPGSNVIHIDSQYLRWDLGNMIQRKGDWNFCALHELGHLFDFFKPWAFDEELLTDLRVAYAMEKYNASASPAEFPAHRVFVGKDILQGYQELSGDLSVKYQVFACAVRFLRIKEMIGWEPFKETFRYMLKNEGAYKGFSREDMFKTFMDILSRFSRKPLKVCFTPKEWDNILHMCRST